MNCAVESPRAGETCLFHEDCCDPTDLACPGNCHAPAVVTFVIPGLQRTPFCAKHREIAATTIDVLE